MKLFVWNNVTIKGLESPAFALSKNATNARELILWKLKKSGFSTKGIRTQLKVDPKIYESEVGFFITDVDEPINPTKGR